MGRRGGRGSDAEQTVAKLAVSVHELAELVRDEAAVLAEQADEVDRVKFRVQVRFRLQRLRDHAVICRNNAATLLAELTKSTNH